MTNIDEKRAKGNYGVFLVASKLAKFCLVRPVPEGTDQGIDLYCESFEEPFRGGRPFLHFWVQVKTTTSIQNDNSEVPYSFDVKHLNYWGRQPVPVFAFLVSIESLDSTEPFKFYVFDITRHILENNLITNRQHCTLYSSMLIQTDADLKRFISELVLNNSALLKLRDGVIARLPSLDPSYEINFPSDLPIRQIDVILSQIRRTSASAIIHIFREDENKSPELAQKRRKLAEILQCFEDNDHWENQYALGLSEMKEGNYPKAKACFEKSLEIINRDPIIDQEKWGPRKETLSRRITQCNEKMSSPISAL